jgi:hypothetical protein
MPAAASQPSAAVAAAAAAAGGSLDGGNDADPSSARPGFAAFVRGNHPHRPPPRRGQPTHPAQARGPGGRGSAASSSSSQRKPAATDHAVYKKFVEHQHQLPNKKR